MVRLRPYFLGFKTTNYCWYRCPHCCENSGPHNPREFLPAHIITGYIDQAVKDPLFNQSVVFTGGEIMSAYRFGDENYVKTLLAHSMKHDLGIDIKTNAGWAGTNIEDKICDDLAQTIADNPTAYPPQISLSLDRFHTNAMRKNARVIQAMVARDSNVSFHLSGFGAQQIDADTEILMKQLANAGLDVQMAFSMRDPNDVQPLWVINGKTVVRYSYGMLRAAGRGTKLENTFDVPDHQFSIFEPDMTQVNVIEHGGRFRLGEAWPKNITTTWRHPDGTARSLREIRNRIVNATRRAELEYMLRNGRRLINLNDFKTR